MRLLLLAFLLACGAPRPARAEGWAPAFSFDYMAATNLIKHARNDARRACDALTALGAPSCESSVSAPGAIGGRAGLIYNTAEFSLGPTVGAYYGGPTVVRRTISVPPTATATWGIRETTFRFLLEEWQRFQVDEDWTVLLGATAGWALVHESPYCSASGGLTCPKNHPRNLGFATWEVGPGVSFRGAEFSIRWLGFARHNAYPWNTFDLIAGYRF